MARHPTEIPMALDLLCVSCPGMNAYPASHQETNHGLSRLARAAGTVLLGSHSAPFAVEPILQGLGSCLAVGIAYNAAARGI